MQNINNLTTEQTVAWAAAVAFVLIVALVLMAYFARKWWMDPLRRYVRYEKGEARRVNREARRRQRAYERQEKKAGAGKPQPDRVDLGNVMALELVLAPESKKQSK